MQLIDSNQISGCEAVDRRRGRRTQRCTVLILTAHIEKTRPLLQVSGATADCVEALTVGATKVIRDCLSKVVAVAQRRACNLCASRVNRFQRQLFQLATQFGSELVLQRALQLFGLRVVRHLSIALQEAGKLKPRPRPHS